MLDKDLPQATSMHFLLHYLFYVIVFKKFNFPPRINLALD